MRLTFALAKEGIPWARPNPLVGAILVKNGKIIGQGHHSRYGSHHAEIDCLKEAQEDVRGATLICNLEPCCHSDKQTPPCTQAIVAAGISKVIVATLDPNPKVNGKGVAFLKAQGIEVQHGFLEEEARKLNEVYFTLVEKGRPFVIAKWAQGLDGSLATFERQSKWISNEKSRMEAHRLRRSVEAVLVGLKTAVLDNPALNIRYDLAVDGYTPYRIVLGDQEKLPRGHQLITDASKDKTLFFPDSKDLNQLMSDIAAKKISSILVEGGATTLGAFFKAGLVDLVHIFIAPKFLGDGPRVTESFKFPSVADGITLEQIKINLLGDDIHLVGRPHYKHTNFPS